jgi:hypothetical protein
MHGQDARATIQQFLVEQAGEPVAEFPQSRGFLWNRPESLLRTQAQHLPDE